MDLQQLLMQGSFMKNRFEPLFQAHLQRILPSAIWELALCSDPAPIVFRDGAWNFYILHKYSLPPSLARSYLITGLLYLSIMLNIHSLPPGPLSHPSPQLICGMTIFLENCYSSFFSRYISSAAAEKKEGGAGPDKNTVTFLGKLLSGTYSCSCLCQWPGRS